MNLNSYLITIVSCSVRAEDIKDPLMQKIRWLDELARKDKLKSLRMKLPNIGYHKSICTIHY